MQAPCLTCSVDRDQPIRCFHLFICPVYISHLFGDLKSDLKSDNVIGGFQSELAACISACVSLYL